MSKWLGRQRIIGSFLCLARKVLISDALWNHYLWSTEYNFCLRLFLFCCCLVAKLCLTLLLPHDCSPPGSSVHGISQAKILEWAAVCFSGGTFWSSDRTHVSWIAGRLFTTEPPGKPDYTYIIIKILSMLGFLIIFMESMKFQNKRLRFNEFNTRDLSSLGWPQRSILGSNL